MKKFIHQFPYKKERGQAIIMVAFGLIGLVAMVGLVIDTGILFIEYGKLKRGVDAAAISAAQQFRSSSGGGALNQAALINAAKNYLQLNESGIDTTNIVVHHCDEAVGAAGRPALCNQNLANSVANRKLVEVSASKFVEFGFLRVIGIKGTTISTVAVGEAATMDLVLVIDTSASMAYGTDQSPGAIYSKPDPGDDPSVCNPNDCEPMKSLKAVAANFIQTMYFPYDRVAIVTMTSLGANGNRNPVVHLPLSSVKTDVDGHIGNLSVFQPRNCTGYPNTYSGDTTPSTCSAYLSGVYKGPLCPYLASNPDPSACNSSNVGGAFLLAGNQLTNPASSRAESFWVIISLLGGPANSTDAAPGFSNGYCPINTWPSTVSPKCRDRHPATTRHFPTDPFVTDLAISPIPFPLYDTDDFARDAADNVVQSTSNGGVTIYTIGLGDAINDTASSDDLYTDGTKIPAAKDLLEYIANEAGEPVGFNPATDIPIYNHGRYFFAPTGAALTDIFELIANNIATRISQ